MPEQERPRVLMVTRNLPPLVGGMERLNWHMSEELAREMSVRVVGPAGAARLAPDTVEVIEVGLRPLAKFLVTALFLAVRIARSWKPVTVIAGSGLTVPIAWLAARLSGANAIVYVHGLDLATRHALYRAFWHPALRRMDRVVANSHATARLAKAIGIEASRIHIVHPGVDVPDTVGQAGAPCEFRAEAGLGDRPLLLSVGRLSSRKGLREFVTDVLPRIVEVLPEALLLIVGDAPRDALGAKTQSQSQIQEAADVAGVGDAIRFLGEIINLLKIQAIYSAADVHVFPVLEIHGDPEGFGMVAVEAAACGLQTVAYSTGGVPDAVANGVSGHLVKPGDARSFADSVIRAVRHPLDPQRIRAFAAGFDWRSFGICIRQALAVQSADESDD